MTKLEWVDLETLSTEVAHLQSRIDAARATRNYGKVRLLEREMTEVTERRNRVIAEITSGLSDASPDGPQLTHFSTNDTVETAGEKQQPAPEIEATSPGAPEPPPPTDPPGDTIMWDTLTRADLERANRGLSTRRAEILARHAEELKALEADQNEIDAFEKAIAAFAEKFNLAKTAEVLVLNKERVSA